MTLRLLLIRHAETAIAMRGRCQGVLDVDLSPLGTRRARALAEILRHEAIDAVYASPLRRAKASAQPLAIALDHELRIEDDLHEIDFGRCEGMTYAEIEVEFPEVYREWMTSPATVEFPEGESFAVVQHRAWATMERLRARHPEGTIAVYTHAGVLRAILGRVLAMPDHAVFRLNQDFGGVNILETSGGFTMLRAMNVRLDQRGGVVSTLRWYERLDDEENE